MSATINPAAIIAKMAKAPARKRTSNRLSYHDDNLSPFIDRFMEAKRQADDWGAIMETTAAQIEAVGTPARLKACREVGRVEASIVLNERLRQTQKSQYCAIDSEREADLRAAFGADFDRYFNPRLKIELTEQAAADEALLAKLIEALGPECFQQSVKVSQSLRVTEQFHADYTLRPEVEALARPFIDDDTIRPFKPAITIA